MQSPFATLPDAIVADLIFAHLPAAELVETVPRVSRQFRRCASLPSAAWRDFEWRCRSLESWMGLLRFLRPRMPAIHTLRLRLAANVPTRRRRRLASRVAAAWATLADRLAAAAALEELSVVWDVGSCSCSSWLRVLYPPLDTATLLPALPRLARRGGRPPPLPRLRCLELSCESGVTLSAALALLPNLQQLSIGPGGYSCSEGTLLPACRRAPAVPACLPATLTALVLSGPWAATSLACCPDLADALPCLRELRMPISTAQFPAYSPGRFLKALLPLAGQLECLELPPHVLPLVVSQFTALQTLVANRAPQEVAPEVWDAILSSLRRLHTLDVTQFVEPDESLTVPLAAAPPTLRHLRLAGALDVDFLLPPGDYLGHLTKLSLGSAPALRLAPLLPFMPQLRHLALECGIHPFHLGSLPPPATGTGDAALDGAVAAAAGLRLATHRRQLAEADALAEALLASRQLRVVEIRICHDRATMPIALSRLAWTLQRASSAIDVRLEIPEEE